MHIIAPRSDPIPQIETYVNFKAYRTMLLGLLVELVLKQLRWIPVKLQLYYRDATLTFKCMTAVAPIYLSSQFLIRGSISGRSTRKANQLNIPLFKKRIRSEDLSLSRCKIMERIPARTKINSGI